MARSHRSPTVCLLRCLAAPALSALVWVMAAPSFGQNAPQPLLAPITAEEAPEWVSPEVEEGTRPLSTDEQRALSTYLDGLAIEGETLYATGQRDAAYEVWVRELRLRQLLGYRNEIAALSRVGQRSWQDDRTEVLRAVGDRLEVVEQVALAETASDLDLLMTIAQTYEIVRKRDEAIAAYGRVLDLSRQRQDPILEAMTLQSLAGIYQNWFDYSNAATVYQELLLLAQGQGDRLRQAEVLEQLAYVYEQDRQYELAIVSCEQLIDLYTAAALETATPEERATVQVMEEPRLRLAIANHYRALQQYDTAARTYQRAIASAQASQQFGYASDALRRLATLYQELGQVPDAIIAYQLLVQVEQQSYSFYGMMDAYDELGQIHRNLGQTAEAIAAFSQAAQLADQLDFRRSYFRQQLESVTP